LDQCLYLIIKKPRQSHQWQFPQGGVKKNEALHETAKRELGEECGSNMQTWFVGCGPIGHYNYPYPPDMANKYGVSCANVFFLKAYIFSGQVQIDNKEVTDFMWVTKRELPQYVNAEYWTAVKDML